MQVQFLSCSTYKMGLLQAYSASCPYTQYNTKSKVIAILKPGKDSSPTKSYRPISLLCHTYKLLERMILNPITEHTIIKEQAGFRVGKSCTSQQLNLTQYMLLYATTRSIIKPVKVPVVEVAKCTN